MSTLNLRKLQLPLAVVPIGRICHKVILVTLNAYLELISLLQYGIHSVK